MTKPYMIRLDTAERDDYEPPTPPFEVRIGYDRRAKEGSIVKNELETVEGKALIWFDTQQVGWRAQALDSLTYPAAIGFTPDDAAEQLELSYLRESDMWGFGTWAGRLPQLHDRIFEGVTPCPYAYSVPVERLASVVQLPSGQFVARYQRENRVYYAIADSGARAALSLTTMSMPKGIYQVALPDGNGEVPVDWADSMGLPHRKEAAA